MDRRERFAVSPHAYGVLLLVILITLGFQLAAPDDGWARLLVVALQGATLLLALRVSDTRALVTRAATIAVSVTVVAAIATLAGLGLESGPTARVLNLLLVSLAPAAIGVGVVREVREEKAVTIRTMFGVLCIYLLVGTLFATVYGLVYDVSNTPFFAQQTVADINDFLYFSFVTITTTGYGDLTAITNIGRSLAITEALIGQIYLVTVVALIVANLGRRRRA